MLDGYTEEWRQMETLSPFVTVAGDKTNRESKTRRFVS